MGQAREGVGAAPFPVSSRASEACPALGRMPPAGLQPPSGAVVDASTAFVALNLLAIGTSGRTVAGVCATSESSVKRIQRHAAQHSGGARVPRKGKGKRHDRRWHFGGAPGQSNLGRLDRLVGSMDASSTHDEIYAAYVATCPLPVPKPSTVAEALRKLEYTTKRLSAYAPDRNDLRCRAWYQRVASLYLAALQVQAPSFSWAAEFSRPVLGGRRSH